MISRLTPMRGGDPMLDPYNPTMFETYRWASSFKPRSAWISEEYQRAFKTVEPWNMEDSMKSRRQWLSDDLLNTYKTREPWNVKGLQDWPGQTKKQWMKVTPKDRYGGDSRSVFKEIDAPFTRPAASDLIDYGGEYDSFKGGPTQGTNIEHLDTDALSGWDAEGGVHVQPDHVSVEMQTLSKMDSDLAAQFAAAGVPIKNENDSFLDSNGDFGTGANQDSIGGSLVDADRIARLNDPDYARVEQRLLPDPGGA